MDVLAEASSLVTVGRGPTLAIAREAALKLKETCNLHAEAFSGAEFLHGPVALVSPEYPMLMFNPTDAAAKGMRQLAANLREKGTALYTTDPDEDGSGHLPVLPPDHPDTDAVCLIQSFYMHGGSSGASARDRRRPTPASQEGHEHAMIEAGRHAVVASTVFDGAECYDDYAVVIEDSAISSLLPRRKLPEGMPTQVLPEGAWLAPGFIDIQVNGGGDVLLNDDPSAAAMAAIARAHRKFGTTALLPTLITDTTEKMRAALPAANEAAAANPSVLGIHLEGPFISPEKRGVHNRSADPLAEPRRHRTAGGAASRGDARHACARARAARLHRAARESRRSRLAWPFDGDL